MQQWEGDPWGNGAGDSDDDLEFSIKQAANEAKEVAEQAAAQKVLHTHSSLPGFVCSLFNGEF